MTANTTAFSDISAVETETPGRNDSTVHERLTLVDGGEGDGEEAEWILVEFPWIPALVVGCGMIFFLSLSFYNHHKRVRRKREMLLDYLYILLTSGAWGRGRSVSILCNTNGLTDTGSSFRGRSRRDKGKNEEDILSEKYLKDLVANMSKGRKKELTRFISDPMHKFTRVGGPMSVRKKSLSVGMFGSSFTSHDGYLFPYDLGRSIDNSILLDPTAHPNLDAHRAKLQRSATDTGPRRDYEIDFLPVKDSLSPDRVVNAQMDSLQAQTPEQSIVHSRPSSSSPKAGHSCGSRTSADNESDSGLNSDFVSNTDIQISVPSPFHVLQETTKASAGDQVPTGHASFSDTVSTDVPSVETGSLTDAHAHTAYEARPNNTHSVPHVTYVEATKAFLDANGRSISEQSARSVREQGSIPARNNMFRPISLETDSHRYHSRSPSPVCFIDEDPDFRVTYLRNHSVDNHQRNSTGLWANPERKVVGSMDLPTGALGTADKMSSVPRASDYLYRATVIRNFLSSARGMEKDSSVSYQGEHSRSRQPSVGFNPIFPAKTHARATHSAFLPAALGGEATDTKAMADSHAAGPTLLSRFAFTKKSRSKSSSRGSSESDDQVPRSRPRGTRGQYLSKTQSTQSTTALLTGSDSPPRDSPRGAGTFDFPGRVSSSFDSVTEETEPSDDTGHSDAQIHSSYSSQPGSFHENDYGEITRSETATGGPQVVGKTRNFEGRILTRHPNVSGSLSQGEGSFDSCGRRDGLASFHSDSVDSHSFTNPRGRPSNLVHGQRSAEAANHAHYHGAHPDVPSRSHLETVLSLDGLVRMDSSRRVRYTTNVERLPRFQVRSSLQRHQQFLARHCSIQVSDSSDGSHEEHSGAGPFWITEPCDTSI